MEKLFHWQLVSFFLKKLTTALNSNKNTAKVPVLVIFAPTAAGKTALLQDLFGKGSPYFFKGKAEVVSADSMQVYRSMNIGTAKPDIDLQNELPHHLIDLCNPDEQFSASKFIDCAQECCKEIYSRKKIPVIAGGTGFYIKSFLQGLPDTPPSDPEVRQNLKEREKSEGIEKLYSELQQIDPISAARINKNDAYRILRAIEVYICAKRPLSSFKIPNELRDGFDFCTIVIGRGREELYERINKRVDIMFDQGLEAEYNSLIKAGYKSDSPGMSAIGYREFAEIFPDGIPSVKNDDVLQKLFDIREKIKKDSRNYAKKQYTIMKDIPEAEFLPLYGEQTISGAILEKISNFMHLTLDVQS